MANALFDTGRASFLDGDIDWTNDTIKLQLHDSDDVLPVAATHDFLNDLTAGLVATSGALSGKGSTAGVASASDVTFSLVSGDTCESIIIYKDTGSAPTSNLIAYIHVATGLPVAPNGGNITVQWDTGANKIFKL